MARHDTGLILPPRFAVRERNAPPARLGAGINGWVEWALVDRRGRVVSGGQSPNMWLNQGLDELATPTSNASILGRGNNVGSGAALNGVTHAVIGTGSTAVSPSNTALASELSRTSTVLSGSVNQTRPSNGVYQLTKTFVWDFAQGNGNLTEWGIARSASLGLLTRALFVDASNNPITITKTSDYQLRLAYTLEVTLAPISTEAASINISGIGTVNGDVRLVAGTQGNSMNDFVFLFDWAAGGTSPAAGLSTDTTFTYTGDLSVPAAGQANVNTPAAYTPGSYERTCSHAWGVSNGNLAGIRSIIGCGYLGNITGHRLSGFTFLIDSGDAFTKTSVDQLVLTDLFTVSWGRG